MKKTFILCLCLLTALTAVFTACGNRTESYAYYEFYCEGDMTVTHGTESAVVLSDEDETALLGLWGNAWTVGKVNGTFDYVFAWEDTTIRYNSARGVFRLGDTKQIMELSREEKEIVESILNQYR